MKLFHIADLHLGKKLSGENLIEDQNHILKEILKSIEKEKPQGILITGDIYDTGIPTTEAVTLLDRFLEALVKLQVEVFIISGNHDSPERLEFANGILENSRIHITGTFRGKLKNYTLKDEFGSVCFYMLPFIKPAMLRPYCEKEPETYEHAVKQALETVSIDKRIRNVLLAHQYITYKGENPVTSDSEQKSLGGIDEVDASCFDDFDYVALGHIHRPQKIKRLEVRYAGSPLKYSFSEINHKKAITVIELAEKAAISIRKIPLTPLRDLAILTDTMNELLSEKYKKYEEGYYLSIVLTDEEPIENPLEKLRARFPGVLEFAVENKRTRQHKSGQIGVDDLALKTPQALFEEFYQRQNNVEVSAEEKKILEKIFVKLGEEPL